LQRTKENAKVLRNWWGGKGNRLRGWGEGEALPDFVWTEKRGCPRSIREFRLAKLLYIEGKQSRGKREKKAVVGSSKKKKACWFFSKKIVIMVATEKREKNQRGLEETITTFIRKRHLMVSRVSKKKRARAVGGGKIAKKKKEGRGNLEILIWREGRDHEGGADFDGGERDGAHGV